MQKLLAIINAIIIEISKSKYYQNVINTNENEFKRSQNAIKLSSIDDNNKQKTTLIAVDYKKDE